MISNLNYPQSTLQLDNMVYSDQNILAEWATTQPLCAELIRHLHMIAPLKKPLLIYGIHGSGRSYLARYLHNTLHQSNEVMLNIDAKNLNVNNEVLRATCCCIINNIDELNANETDFLMNIISRQEHQIKFFITASPSFFQLVRQHKCSPDLFSMINITPIEIPALYKLPEVCHFAINYYAQYPPILRYQQQLCVSCLHDLVDTIKINTISDILWLFEHSISSCQDSFNTKKNHDCSTFKHNALHLVLPSTRAQQYTPMHESVYI